MKKNILLIYPEIPDTYWSFKYALPFAGKKAQFPPLGIITVAAMLPDDYNIKVIDMNVTPLRKKDIIPADLIFISAMIVQKHSFNSVIKLCKSMGKTIVAGGPYPTSSYKMITGVDHFILGEAEETLSIFLQDYDKGQPKPIYFSDKKPDIKKTPVPRYDLLKIKNYFSMVVQFSRGCPYNCEFCDIIEMFGRVPRTKNPEQLIEEIQTIYDTGYRGSVFVVDDNFIGNKKVVKELLIKIERWQTDHGFPFSFFTESSVNLAEEEELLEMMVSAGFMMVFLGIETPDEATLLCTQKKQNTKRELLESVKIIQKAGLEVSAGFIIGFDNDPENIFDLQINFIQEAGIVMSMVGLLTALPNTQLYRRLDSENRITGESSGNNTHMLELNFIPRMKIEKIISGYKKVISDIYNPKKYFERCLKMITLVKKRSQHKRPIRFQEVRAFITSFLRITFSRCGYEYLSFLRTILKKYSALFPEGIRMGIMLYHFHVITKKILKENKTAY